MSNNKFMSVFYTKLSSSAPQTTKQPSSSEKYDSKLGMETHLHPNITAFIARWGNMQSAPSPFPLRASGLLGILKMSNFLSLFINTCFFFLLLDLWQPNGSLRVCVCLSIRVYRYMLFSCGSVVTQCISEGVCLFYHTCLSIHAVFSWVSVDPMCLWGLKYAKETFSCIWFYGMK